MPPRLNSRLSTANRPKQENFNRFEGRRILVDLAAVNDQTGKFEGTDWLESKMNAKQSIGFSLIWTLDRHASMDHPVALLCFADNSTVLLLRSVRTEHWLPPIVQRVLQQPFCTKVTIDWEKKSKSKMDKTFHWQPMGMEDLADLSRKKGVECIGLKQLAREFGLNIQKDASVERMDWAAENISDEQLQYAAEDVYFTFILYDKLMARDDAEKENPHMEDGLLAMAAGWEEQGIRRRHDGLFCDICGVGPMSDPKNVPEHLRSGKHIRRTKDRLGIVGGETEDTPMELPDDWVMNGIEITEKTNQNNEFKCRHCGISLQMGNVKSHIASKKHKKMVDGLLDDPNQEYTPLSRFKEQLLHRIWNLPDYVKVLEPSSLICEICPVMADSVQQMMNHLAGNNHRKTCLGCKPPLPELVYVAERERLEDLWRGSPILRTGHEIPRKSHKKALPGGERPPQRADRVQVPERPSESLQAARAQVPERPSQQPAQVHQQPSQSAEQARPDRPFQQQAQAAQWPSQAQVPERAAQQHAQDSHWPEHAQQEPSQQHVQVSQWPEHAQQQPSQTWPQHAQQQASQQHVQTSQWSEHEQVPSQSSQPVQSWQPGQTWQAPGAREHHYSQPQPDERAHVSEQKSWSGELGHTQEQRSWSTEQAQGPEQHARQPAERVQGQPSQQEEDLTPATPAVAPQPPAAQALSLPPGWDPMVDQASGRRYYVDAENWTSHWEPPPEYKHMNFTRVSDAAGRCFWVDQQGKTVLYEDDSNWLRRLDSQGRTYWSCPSTGHRFFEWDPNRDS